MDTPMKQISQCVPLPLYPCGHRSHVNPSPGALQEGRREQALDRDRRMTHLGCECTYRRAEEEEDIHLRSSACSQQPPCLDVSAFDTREARTAVLHTPVNVNTPGGARAAEAGGTRPTRGARPRVPTHGLRVAAPVVLGARGLGLTPRLAAAPV